MKVVPIRISKLSATLLSIGAAKVEDEAYSKKQKGDAMLHPKAIYYSLSTSINSITKTNLAAPVDQFTTLIDYFNRLVDENSFKKLTCDLGIQKITPSQFGMVQTP